jgi:hypothetical protein
MTMQIDEAFFAGRACSFFDVELIAGAEIFCTNLLAVFLHN